MHSLSTNICHHRRNMPAYSTNTFWWWKCIWHCTDGVIAEIFCRHNCTKKLIHSGLMDVSYLVYLCTTLGHQASLKTCCNSVMWTFAFSGWPTREQRLLFKDNELLGLCTRLNITHECTYVELRNLVCVADTFLCSGFLLPGMEGRAGGNGVTHQIMRYWIPVCYLLLPMLSWFAFYLYSRAQPVSVSINSNRCQILNCGLLQGSEQDLLCWHYAFIPLHLVHY